ncbi:MAG: hypothetical protein LQ343_005089 [Gyalolechia ehrenbergii]|nr:MAG: hypothetical protein LQ343_005089 [Gyalolechia ehrenbergii]
MATIEDKEQYGYDGLTGWRSYRILRPGRGIYHDIRRRLPYYRSDLTDALTYRTAASIVPLAFILDMYRRTDGQFGVNEALFSSALAAMVFSIAGAQPLTIVGITGLISLFNYTIYDIIKIYDAALYEPFLVWVGIWAAIFHWLFAIWNTCDYMRYVTDFSSQSFGMYVGIIYGVEELVAEFTTFDSTQGFISCVIAILYFGTIYSLETIGHSTLFRPWFRGVVADYAYPLGTIFWVGFAHIPGPLRTTNVSFLPVSPAFHPTVERNWVVNFWTLPVKWVFVAVPMGFLVMLLFYYDHNVSSITAQAKQFPLKKPGGFHWDFFLLGVTTFVSSIFFVPFPNGLVPQAPVHTDSLTVYETKLKRLSYDDKEQVEPDVIATSVVEQRLSHFVMGLAIIGTMTGPLLIVLHTMPRSIFAGVFFVVGWGSIESNGILHRLVWLVREPRFIQPTDPLLTIRRSKIGLYVFWQALGVLSTVAISQTIAAIGFPVLIIALIPLRWLLLPKMFSVKELIVLDALTADNGVVLASLGGKPNMPEQRKDSPYDKLEEGQATEAIRQRVGSIHR